MRDPRHPVGLHLVEPKDLLQVVARGYDSAVYGQSSFFLWLNRGKRSVTLDVKQPAARDALQKLVDGADVLLQNLAPGAAARLVLDRIRIVLNGTAAHLDHALTKSSHLGSITFHPLDHNGS